MRLADKIEIQVVEVGFDEELNPTETTKWKSLGKCSISPNNAARVTKTNDGTSYIYSYEIIMRKPKTNMPKENDVIHIVKSDNTIDAECRVVGFVTLRNWLKLWV